MWARVDYCSVILFDSFPTSKARDHMALFVFTDVFNMENPKEFPHQELIFTRFTDGRVSMEFNWYMPDIDFMRGIIKHAKSYIKKYKTNEGVSAEVKRIHMEQMYEEEMQRRASRGIKKEPVAAKSLSSPCNIYLIKDTLTGHYKIGKTKSNVEYRLSQLKTGNPNLVLAASFKGIGNDEKILHETFIDKKIIGEWFEITDSEIEFIKQYFTVPELPF